MSMFYECKNADEARKWIEEDDPLLEAPCLYFYEWSEDAKDHVVHLLNDLICERRSSIRIYDDWIGGVESMDVGVFVYEYLLREELREIRLVKDDALVLTYYEEDGSFWQRKTEPLHFSVKVK